MSAALLAGSALASPVGRLTLAAGGEAKKSGPLGLVVILVLCVACYFLFKSMSKHMKTVREDFPTELPPEPGRPSDLAGDTPGPAPEPAEGDATPSRPEGDQPAP